MTAVLQQSLSAKQSIHFMPTDVSDEAEYIKGVSTYILHISGALINGQKTIVDITEKIYKYIDYHPQKHIKIRDRDY
ncbi:2574_t:CDS:2 [Scutellospora calospora]|uniref:2574_t:CDS:1 n=1 Tax=Scutellospora calospora TaxID=85575 RepID=A0ACA9LX43_9GLOM|nr:2574_t:CDS:2 [Scutellospora calospora]